MTVQPQSHDLDAVWPTIVAEYETAAAATAQEAWDCAFCGQESRPSRVLICLNGNVENDKYCVVVNGSNVWLTLSPFQTLVDLVAARLKAGVDGIGLKSLAGSKESVYQSIKRLRDAIDASLGKTGYGAQIVRHRAKGEYSLDISPSQVQVHPRLRELVPAHLSEDAVATILAKAIPSSK